MTEVELNQWVNGCAEYLREKKVRDLQLGVNRASREELDEAGLKELSFYDYQGLMSELDSSLREIQTAIDRANKLQSHFAFDRLIPFNRVSHRVTKAGTLLSEAWAEMRCAQIELSATTRQNTRGLDLHKSAVRLAYGAVDHAAPRRTREIAKRIIDKAGLEPPDEKSLSNWIKEIKAEGAEWNGK